MAGLVREDIRVVHSRGVDKKAGTGKATLANLNPFFAGLAIKIVANNPAMRRQMRGGANPSELAKYPLGILDQAKRLKIS